MSTVRSGDGARLAPRRHEATMMRMEPSPYKATPRETAGVTLLLIAVTAAMIWSVWAFSGAPAGGEYVAPQLQDGKIIPGTFK